MLWGNYAVRASERSDANALALAGGAANGFEIHHTIHQGEQGVVLALTDVDAWQHSGAALADQDGTGGDGFAALGLDAQALGIGIATVAG